MPVCAVSCLSQNESITNGPEPIGLFDVAVPLYFDVFFFSEVLLAYSLFLFTFSYIFYVSIHISLFSVVSSLSPSPLCLYLSFSPFV